MKKKINRMAPAAKPPAEPEVTQQPEPEPSPPPDAVGHQQTHGTLPEPLFRSFNHCGDGRMDFLRNVEHLRFGLWQLLHNLSAPAPARGILLQGLVVQEHLRECDWRPSAALSMPGPLWAECEVFFCLLSDALVILSRHKQHTSTVLAVSKVIDHLKTLCYHGKEKPK